MSYNSSSGEAEARGSLGLASKSYQLVSSWFRERLCPKNKTKQEVRFQTWWIAHFPTKSPGWPYWFFGYGFV